MHSQDDISMHWVCKSILQISLTHHPWKEPISIHLLFIVTIKLSFHCKGDTENVKKMWSIGGVGSSMERSNRLKWRRIRNILHFLQHFLRLYAVSSLVHFISLYVIFSLDLFAAVGVCSLSWLLFASSIWFHSVYYYIFCCIYTNTPPMHRLDSIVYIQYFIMYFSVSF